MFNPSHFISLCNIQRKESWRKNVDESCAAGFDSKDEKKLCPVLNIGMLRPKHYPYNNRNQQFRRGEFKLPFRSREWDRFGTRFYSIPINIAQTHWTGVIVERHKRHNDNDQPTGTLYYYDLFTSKRGEDRLRKQIMKRIAESLNLVPDNTVATARNFLPPFQWKYIDVVSSSFCKNDEDRLQKDCYSCGVIWMMILWFVLTKERAPTLEDCKELDLTDHNCESFRAWVLHSILADQIWLPPELYDPLRDLYDVIEVPSKKEWRRNLTEVVVSKLPSHKNRRIDGNDRDPKDTAL
jgi:hypothetical protein